MEQNKVTMIPKPIQMMTNFWPALLVILLVGASLPSTVPDLKEIPERLILTMSEAARTKAKKPEKPALPDLVKKEEEPEPIADSGNTYPDGVYTGSSRGYGGDISVQVTVAGGRISAVEVLSAPGETAEFLNMAKGVIDRVLQAQTWEVDTVSGATYSSRGILGAIQNALTGQKVQNAAPFASEQAAAPSQAPEAEPYDDSAAWKDGVYTGTARGYGGNITVEVTIEGGKIANIRVLEHSGESGSYFDKALAVVDRILSANSPNVDTVSGATYSSTGIINAVKRALQKAEGGNAADDDPNGEEAGDGTEPDTQVPADPEQDKQEEPDHSNGFNDGTYQVEVACTDGRLFDYTIRLTMAVKNGIVQSIKAERTKDNSENPEINQTYLGYAVSGRSVDGKQYRSVIEQVIAAQSTKNIDVVSGATWSSNAILNGIRQLFAKAAKNKADVEDPSAEDSKTQTPGGSRSQTPGGSKTPQNDRKDDQEAEQEPDPVLDDGLKDGTYTIDAVCTDDPDDPLFDYTVRVTMKIRGGVIRAISAKIIKDRSEDPSVNKTYFGYAVNGRTKNGQKQKGIPVQILANQSTKDVDIVSGATWSSRTILNTVKKLLRQAAKVSTGEPDEDEEETGTGKKPEEDPEEKPGKDSGGKTDSSGGNETEQPSGGETDPSQGGEVQMDPVKLKDGTYTSEVICTDDPKDPTFDYTIAVTVLIENGAIASIDAVRAEDRSYEPEDNERYFGFARDGRTRKGVVYKGVIAQVLEAQTADGIDAVSTATYSSNALIRGIREALEKAVPAGEQEESGTDTGDPGSTELTGDPANESPADPGGKDPSNPGGKEPGTEDPSDSGTGAASDPGGKEPGTEDSSESGTGATSNLGGKDPGTEDPSESGTGAASEPGGKDPGTEDPSESGTGAASDPGGKDSGTEDPSESGTGDPSDPGEEAPSDSGTVPGQEQQKQYLDGSYTSAVLCTDNPDDPFFYYEVEARVVIEEGGITSVTVTKINDDSDDPSENEGYMKYAVNGRKSTAGIPDQVLEKQSGENLDAVSGATYTSGALIEAVRNALAAAQNPDY